MVELEELQERLVEFRDERDWDRYHTPKNLCLSISIEASELLELFQWKEDNLDGIPRERLEEEMADVFIYLLLLSETAGVDLGKAVKQKIEDNEEKYPSEEYEQGKNPW